ncbi:MAG: hypothetical protein RLZZ15_593 [Verrucomicrobiota bacterium]
MGHLDFNVRLERIERDLADRREIAHDQNTKWIEMIDEVQQSIVEHDKVLATLPQAFAAQTTVLTEIKTALAGDTFGNRGLVGRQAASEAEIMALKAATKVEFDRINAAVETHDRKIWLAGGALTALWGAILAFKDKIFH